MRLMRLTLCAALVLAACVESPSLSTDDDALAAFDGSPKWTGNDRLHLTYCIDPTIIEPERSVLRDAMNRASAGWESAADVNFEEIVAPQEGCHDQTRVTFNIRYFSCEQDGDELENEDEICKGTVLDCSIVNPGDPMCFPPFAARAFRPNDDREDRVLLIGNRKTLGVSAVTTFGNGPTFTMRHELGHILGFAHEFARTDFCEMYPDAEGDDICATETDWLTPADASSVMSYPQIWEGGTPGYFTDDDLWGAASYYGVARNDLVSGDFDGDGVADFLLRAGRAGNVLIDFSKIDRRSDFLQTPAYGGDWDQISVGAYGWIEHPNAQVFTGHFHDARFSDLALKDDDTGAVYVDFGFDGITAGGWQAVYFGYGGAASRVAPADYDGDGLTDLAVRSSTTRQWSIDYSSLPNGGSRYGAIDRTFGPYSGPLGDVHTLPVPADYDGDGRADIAEKTRAGTFAIDYSRLTNTGAVCTAALPCFGTFNTPLMGGYGGSSFLPFAGDFDGDGRADLGVRNVSAGTISVDWAADGFGSIGAGFPRSGYNDANWTLMVGRFRDRQAEDDLAMKRRITTGLHTQRFDIDTDVDRTRTYAFVSGRQLM